MWWPIPQSSTSYCDFKVHEIFFCRKIQYFPFLRNNLEKIRVLPIDKTGLAVYAAVKVSEELFLFLSAGNKCLRHQIRTYLGMKRSNGIGENCDPNRSKQTSLGADLHAKQGLSGV
jgi:hypothetical protein